MVSKLGDPHLLHQLVEDRHDPIDNVVESRLSDWKRGVNETVVRCEMAAPLARRLEECQSVASKKSRPVRAIGP